MAFRFLLLSLLVLPSSLEGQGMPAPAQSRDTVPLVSLPALEISVLRTPMPAGEAPLSVSVLGARELKDGRAGTSLEEALQALPGLQIQNRYNYSTGERVILRGQGARTQFGIRGLRVEIDGVPATLPDGQTTLDHLDMLSMGRVEVLRGPASALYGNGAGGVLRFTSLPVPNRGQEAEALVLAGSHGLLRTGGMVAGSVGRTGYRLSAGFLDWDGYRTAPGLGNDTYGRVRRWNGHGTLRRPLGGGTLGLTASFLDQDSENPGSLSRSLLAEDRLQAFSYNVSQETGEEVRQGLVGISWEREWPALTLELGAHGLSRGLWNPIPPAIIDLERHAGGIRGKLAGQKLWGELELGWALGGEAEGQRDQRKNYSNLAGRPGETTLDQEEGVLGLGGYFQGRLAFRETISVLAGFRLDRVRFRAQDRLISEGDPDDSGIRSMAALSPILGVRFSITEGVSLRGSVSTFFQTPTTSELANRPDGAGGINPTLDPQRGRTLETGLDARLGPGVHLEAVLFQTRMEDQLIPFEVASAPGRSYFRNAGNSRMGGVEIAAFGSLPGDLRIRGVYTYTEATFRQFTLDGMSLAGNAIPGVTPHRLEAVSRWDISSGSSSLHFLEARLLYSSSLPVDDPNSDRTAPYALVDLRGGLEGWMFMGRRISLFGGITNLLDRSYVAAVTVNAFGGRFFEPGPGRSFFLGFRAFIPSSSPAPGPDAQERLDHGLH